MRRNFKDVGLVVCMALIIGLGLYADSVVDKRHKRDAFRAGCEQQQNDNYAGHDKYGFTYFERPYSDAEIDSILEAR